MRTQREFLAQLRDVWGPRGGGRDGYMQGTVL